MHVSNDMVEAGKRMASSLINAEIQIDMDGLGGVEKFNVSNYHPDDRRIINDYLDKEIETVEAIYRAMEKAR